MSPLRAPAAVAGLVTSSIAVDQRDQLVPRHAEPFGGVPGQGRVSHALDELKSGAPVLTELYLQEPEVFDLPFSL
jgi:hypothetical protein